jgi:hypothetical protein
MSDDAHVDGIGRKTKDGTVFIKRKEKVPQKLSLQYFKTIVIRQRYLE